MNDICLTKVRKRYCEKSLFLQNFIVMVKSFKVNIFQVFTDSTFIHLKTMKVKVKQYSFFVSNEYKSFVSFQK